MVRGIADRRAHAAVGGLAFIVLGLTGLLVPSLIRSIEADFSQDDAGMGVYYLVTALAYAVGSLGGGGLTEHRGRRGVLAAGLVLAGVGLALQGTTPAWSVFIVGGLLQSTGSGAIDGGINGLFLDLFPSGRGRPMLLLHVCFGLGAMLAAFSLGRAVDSGIAWRLAFGVTAAASVALAVVFAALALPTGRRIHVPSASLPPARLGLPVLALCAAIACYIGAEVGVSNWLVRFLATTDVGQATGGLGLFWAGLALGRLLAAPIPARMSAVTFTVGTAVAASIALLAAVLAPALGLSIALFALVGILFGPIYPMIVAIAGDLHPDRSAAVAGVLGAAAVVGAVAYPPVMGFLSVTVGLSIAMVGAAVLALASGVAILLARNHVGGARPA